PTGRRVSEIRTALARSRRRPGTRADRQKASTARISSPWVRWQDRPSSHSARAAQVQCQSLATAKNGRTRIVGAGMVLKWEQCPPSDLVTLRTRRLLYLFLTGAWVATARRPTRVFLNPIRAVSAGRILAERPGIHRHTIRRRQIHVPTVHATQPRVLFAGAVAVGMRGLHQMWGTMMLRAMCRAPRSRLFPPGYKQSVMLLTSCLESVPPDQHAA